MPENKMKEVAQMLGVEIGEEFIVEEYGEYIKFKFNNDYLIMMLDGMEWSKANDVLTDLLNGKLKIVKLPKRSLAYE